MQLSYCLRWGLFRQTPPARGAAEAIPAIINTPPSRKRTSCPVKKTSPAA